MRGLAYKRHKSPSSCFYIINSSTKLRSISLRSLPSHPGAGCAPSATAALPVASGRPQPHPEQSVFARDHDFQSKAFTFKNLTLLWYLNSDGAFREGSPGGGRGRPGLGTRSAPGRLMSSEARPGAARAPAGASTRRRLLGTAAEVGERAPRIARRHRSSFPSSFPETETTTAVHRPVPFYSTPA